jgi:type IV pilus assembly protein PilM
MMGMFPAHTLGIDLGERGFRLAYLKTAGGHSSVEAWAAGDRDQACFDGNRWSPGLFEDLHLAVAMARIRPRRAVVSLPDSMVTLSYRKLPPMPPAEVPRALLWEMRKDLSFDPAETVLDHVSLGEYSEGGARMEAYLAALAPKRSLVALCSRLEEAGLPPAALEVSTLAQVSCLRRMGEMEGTVGVVDLAASRTNLLVAREGQVRFFRVIPAGGEHLTEAIAQATGLPRAEAERRKTTASPAERPLTSRTVEGIIDEVFQTLRFYAADRKEGLVERLVLTGGGSMLPGMVAALSEVIGMPAAAADPFPRLPLGERAAEPDRARAMAPRLVTAIGLALRE